MSAISGISYIATEETRRGRTNGERGRERCGRARVGPSAPTRNPARARAAAGPKGARRKAGGARGGGSLSERLSKEEQAKDAQLRRSEDGRLSQMGPRPGKDEKWRHLHCILGDPIVRSIIRVIRSLPRGETSPDSGRPGVPAKPQDPRVPATPRLSYARRAPGQGDGPKLTRPPAKDHRRGHQGASAQEGEQREARGTPGARTLRTRSWT